LGPRHACSRGAGEPVLRRLKLSVLALARASGLLRMAAGSAWRRDQLLILCYHGISIADEHEFAPGLFMTADRFEQRLDQLRRGGYNVLTLGDALTQLYAGTLPSRSVVITFDDGNSDFHRRAWPLLTAYGMPATVYLTTFYCEHSLAVFPLALGYVFWKGRGHRAEVALPGGRPLAIDAASAEGRRRAEAALLAAAQATGMSAYEKDTLVATVAAALGVDYQSIREQRLFQIMNPDEVREVAAGGADVQLHTHRHRSPLDEGRYRVEISANAQRIEAITGVAPAHFCYPSGTHRPQFERWLDAEGVLSATTCEPGIATRASNPLRLPRLLDHSTLTDTEFEAWLSGLGALMPHRPIGNQDVDREGRLVIAVEDEHHVLPPATRDRTARR
jgi:peptidoglycan/xylan/chitin deacetylase (PgdA/CDA1 family)